MPHRNGPHPEERSKGARLEGRTVPVPIAATRISLAFLALTAISLLATPAHAVRPAEMLADPALEARARDIGRELRCLVCRNQSIDDSDADLAHDLRV